MTRSRSEIKIDIEDTKEKLKDLEIELEKASKDPVIVALESFNVCNGKRLSVWKSTHDTYFLKIRPNDSGNVFMAESLEKVLDDKDLKLHSIEFEDQLLTVGFKKTPF